MKIALVILHLDVAGGTQRQFLELAHYLASEGHRVQICAKYWDPSLCYPGLQHGFEVRFLAKRDNINSGSPGWMRSVLMSTP